MSLDRSFAAPARHLRSALAQLRHQRFHPLSPPTELLGLALGLRGEDGHGESLSRGYGAGR
jgi:hypothetical protein